MGIWAKTIERLKLEPVFGVKVWDARSTCADVHPHGDMPDETNCCCMACHRCGREAHPSLRETATDVLARQNWEPEDGKDPWSGADRQAKAEATRYLGSSKAKSKATRKQKRAAKFRAESDENYRQAAKLASFIEGVAQVAGPIIS